jgi:microcystin-dependent protein
VIVTNQTGSDYWFGPLHLPAGVGQQITVDDTSAISLYLTDDAVADAINNLAASNKITVTGAADPFPRPTGVPTLLHGDGVPEGLVYAPQGSIYARRDGKQTNGGVLYMKTTGITLNTGWVDLATASGATAALPPGTLTAFGGSTAPSGWLVCDGSAISRTTYSLLFAVVGTSYGAGDGSTTFNLPDLRGRTPVGYAAGGNADVATLGLNDGVALANRRPKHQHSPHTHTHDASAGGSQNGQLGRVVTTGDGSSGTATTADAKDGGSGNANDPLDTPAYLVVNHIIKT